MQCSQGISAALVLLILGTMVGVSVTLWFQFDKESSNELDEAIDRGLTAVQTSLQDLDQVLLNLLEADIAALRASEALLSPQDGLELLGKIDDATPPDNLLLLYFETLYTLGEVDDYLTRMKTLYSQSEFIIYDLDQGGNVLPINETNYGSRLPIQVIQRLFPENWAGAGRFPSLGSREIRGLNIGTAHPMVINGSAFLTPVSCAIINQAELCSIILTVGDASVLPSNRGLLLSFDPASIVPVLTLATPTVFVEISDANGQAFFQSSPTRPSLDSGRHESFVLPMINTHWNVDVTLIKNAVSISQWDTLKTVVLAGGISFGVVISVFVFLGMEWAIERQKRVTAEHTRASILQGIAHLVLTSLHKLSLVYSSPTREPADHEPMSVQNQESKQEEDPLLTSPSSSPLSVSPLSAAKRTISTLHGVTDLMRLLTRKLPELQPVQMASIHTLVEPFLKKIIDPRHVTFHLPENDPLVLSDRLFISICLKHLVGKAIRHSSDELGPRSIHVYLGSRLPKPNRWERHWGKANLGAQMIHFSVESMTTIDDDVLKNLGTITQDSHGLGYSVLSTCVLSSSVKGYIGIYRSKEQGQRPKVIVDFGLPSHPAPPVSTLVTV